MLLVLKIGVDDGKEIENGIYKTKYPIQVAFLKNSRQKSHRASARG